jgi:hypothetical protein
MSVEWMRLAQLFCDSLRHFLSYVSNFNSRCWIDQQLLTFYHDTCHGSGLLLHPGPYPCLKVRIRTHVSKVAEPAQQRASSRDICIFYFHPSSPCLAAHVSKYGAMWVR